MHVTPVGTLDHHRTVPMLLAAALAVVLAITSFVVVDELTSSGSDRSVRPAATTSGAAEEASVLDPAHFDRAVAEGLAGVTTGDQSAVLDGDGFDRAVADQVDRLRTLPR